jgi:hypothetical protein
MGDSAGYFTLFAAYATFRMNKNCFHIACLLSLGKRILNWVCLFYKLEMQLPLLSMPFEQE